jgi:hypothetical protein
VQVVIVIPHEVAIWQTASAYWVQKSSVVAGPPEPPPLQPANISRERTVAPRNFNGFIAYPPVFIKGAAV